MHIGFDALKAKLMAQGKSAEQAGGIAYKVGVQKYGKKGMVRRAALGRRKGV